MKENDFFRLYNCLCSCVDSSSVIECSGAGGGWALIEASSHVGIAMDTEGTSISPLFPGGFIGEALNDAAKAVSGWNFAEASYALAAINCALNTPENIARLHAEAEEKDHYTNGLDFTGKTVGFVGHLKGSDTVHKNAKLIYILEREPKTGDYPDSAADVLLPQCDIVIITGATIINKTLPHILELCQNAYTVLTGPSVPLCPDLLDFGIDMISGIAITNTAAAKACIRSDKRLSPFPWGQPFMLRKN